MTLYGVMCPYMHMLRVAFAYPNIKCNWYRLMTVFWSWLTSHQVSEEFCGTTGPWTRFECV